MNLLDMLKAEPVAAQVVVQAGIGLICAFGFNLTGVQIAAIMSFSAALLGFIARKNVTANVNVPQN